jgi:predicted transcriptional regulator
MREGGTGSSFTAKEREMVELMKRLGTPKNISRIVVFLSKAGETNSRKIETALQLKQSEVSVIIKRLRERGWVSSRSIKKPAKGRPIQMHRLKFSLGRIAKDIETEKNKEIDGIKNKITRLKRLAK